MAAPRKGTIVDQRYKLDRKIGSGGMADVWLADDKELDRKVAIKILAERFAQDKEFVERFRREAQSAAGLQHPNVVSIFDRGEFRDTYFIAMEYVDGPQLKQLVKGGMGTQDAIDFTRQILNAARFAHRKGIVHRDLKPQNVLIDEDGRARVADFGIARGESSDITATGSVMGTAQYLSPEQAQGKETTPRSDIYSIGVILYEALTGRVPFEGDSAVAVALKQVSETPRRPSTVNPAVPPALDAVVMRALAKDPDARFKDADAFMKALDAAERAPDQPRPEDTAAFAAVSPEGEHAYDDEDEEDWRDEDDRRRRRRWILLALLVAAVAGLVAFALTRPGTVTVPSVTGIPEPTATERLEAEGLDVDIDPVPSTAPRETVLEQDPIAGEKVDEGSTVTLSVSSGPAIVTVPERQRPTREGGHRADRAGGPPGGPRVRLLRHRARGAGDSHRARGGHGHLSRLDREPDHLARLQQGRGARRGRARRPAGAVDPQRQRAGRQRRGARRRCAGGPGRRPEPGPRAHGQGRLAGDDLRLQRRDLRSRRGGAGPQAGGDRHQAGRLHGVGHRGAHGRPGRGRQWSSSSSRRPARAASAATWSRSRRRADALGCPG